MTLTPEQLRFLSRLDIKAEDLALASQTCGIREYIASRVESRGSMNGVWRNPAGSGVERYGEAMDRLWPVAKKVRK